MLKTIIAGMSLRSLPLSISTVVIGTASAYLYGLADPVMATFCLLFAVTFQATINLWACYLNMKDKNNVQELDMVTGIQEVKVPSGAYIKEALTSMGILMAIFGAAIVISADYWAIPIAILIALCVYLNLFIKKDFARGIVGAFVTFFGFGPLGTLATYLLQADHAQGYVFPLPPMEVPIIGSLIIGLFSLNTFLIYTYSTYQYDTENGNNTLATTFGQRTVRIFFIFNTLILFLLQALTLAFMKFPGHPALWVVISINFIINLGIYYRMTTAGIREYAIRLQNIAMYNTLFFAICVLVTFIIFGIPDVDVKIYF